MVHAPRHRGHVKLRYTVTIDRFCERQSRPNRMCVDGPRHTECNNTYHMATHNPHDIVALFDTLLLEGCEASEDEPRDDDYDEILGNIRSASTFRDAQVLTTDAGLVVRMQDGSEFQVTVVRSK